MEAEDKWSIEIKKKIREYWCSFVAEILSPKRFCAPSLRALRFFMVFIDTFSSHFYPACVSR